MQLANSQQFRGDDIPLKFVIAQKPGGAPLTGVRVDFTVRDPEEQFICHLSTADGTLVKISDEPHRLIVEGEIPKSATVQLAAKNITLQFDTQLTLPSGKVRTLRDGTGTFTLLKDVTY